jgi:catechol 2,3-dioxygenase-like lactoylglutathione lyase family enzyme
MIQKLTHVTFFVHDQDAAKDFYVNKLGFEVRFDQTAGNGFRWLTVAPKGQDIEIILMKITPNQHMDAETAAALEMLLKKGVLGGGVFSTPDCRQTYNELSKKGVAFDQPPAERFYGIEAVMKDNQGNWFSLTEPKA